MFGEKPLSVRRLSALLLGAVHDPALTASLQRRPPKGLRPPRAMSTRDDVAKFFRKTGGKVVVE